MRGHAVAVCDIDRARRDAGAAIIGPRVRVFHDYREMLEQTDIDAVVVATPDHWHALMAAQACEAGKDVYLETPVCRAGLEGGALVHAASWYGRVVHSGRRPGYAGALETLRAWTGARAANSAIVINAAGPANHSGGDPAVQPLSPPANLDWNLWLGPERYRPWHPDITHAGWRWMLDFGGGLIRDEGVEILTLLIEAGILPHTGRVIVTAEGTTPSQGFWDCPMPFRATMAFDGGATFVWSQDGAAQTSNFAIEEAETAFHARIEEGVWRVDNAPESAAAADLHDDPPGQWIEAIRARLWDQERLDMCCAAAALGHLANVAFTRARPVSYDLGAGLVPDDPATERMLRPPGREGFRL